ncbi:unnamed protein product, partial [Nesidiocoris tenuis]
MVEAYGLFEDGHYRGSKALHVVIPLDLDNDIIQGCRQFRAAYTRRLTESLTNGCLL